jgi:hypothetical protein
MLMLQGADRLKTAATTASSIGTRYRAAVTATDTNPNPQQLGWTASGPTGLPV